MRLPVAPVPDERAGDRLLVLREGRLCLMLAVFFCWRALMLLITRVGKK
jgi:hypothetical protein